MKIEFKLPELGENIISADIVQVLISEGDMVKKDQPILEVETDKATIEVPSSIEGIVEKINVKVGDKVKIGEVVFTAKESEQEEKTASQKEEINDEKPINKTKPETKSGNIIEVKLPELGENIEGAEITQILVSVGDKISKGENILELESEKASMEVPIDYEGIVKEIRVKTGDKIKVGNIILLLETTEDIAAEKNTPNEKLIRESSPKEVDEPSEEIEEKPERRKISLSKEDIKRMPAPATPSVRRFAREIGININNVKGNGPGGRISIKDVKKYSKAQNEKNEKGNSNFSAFGIVRENLPKFSKFGKVRTEKMSNVRRKTAEHLAYSWISIPHVTQFDKADITELEKIRKKYNPLAEKEGAKLTITAILLKIIANALKKFPQFNASIDMENEEVIYKEYFNIGIAVDTERGLIVPVIREVDKKSIIELATDLADISEKARNRKIGLEDMQGGNFTISNLGGIGGKAFTPIVNSPEVAILGVSRGAYEPIYKEGQFEPRLMLPLSLSYDHRLIDGADGARFIRWIVEALENPLFLSL